MSDPITPDEARLRLVSEVMDAHGIDESDAIITLSFWIESQPDDLIAVLVEEGVLELVYRGRNPDEWRVIRRTEGNTR